MSERLKCVLRNGPFDGTITQFYFQDGRKLYPEFCGCGMRKPNNSTLHVYLPEPGKNVRAWLYQGVQGKVYADEVTPLERGKG